MLWSQSFGFFTLIKHLYKRKRWIVQIITINNRRDTVSVWIRIRHCQSCRFSLGANFRPFWRQNWAKISLQLWSLRAGLLRTRFWIPWQDLSSWSLPWSFILFAVICNTCCVLVSYLLHTIILQMFDQQCTKYKNISNGAVVVVKWSVCSPSTPVIRVRVPLNPTVFSCKNCVWKERK